MEDSFFRFEVRKKNRVIFHCESKECVPSKEAQRSMLNAGYSIFVNGKERGA